MAMKRKPSVVKPALVVATAKRPAPALAATRRASSALSSGIAPKNDGISEEAVHDDRKDTSPVSISLRSHEAHKLKLLHITKCAGAALERWAMTELSLRWGKRWSDANPSQCGGLMPPHTGKMRCEWWHAPPRFYVNNPYASYSVFAIVRCPYTRAISEFRCRWKGFCAPVRENDRGAIGRQRRANVTAADLNTWIQAMLSNGASRPPFTNGHWIPQHYYIFIEDGEQTVPKERVLRMEDLGNCLPGLMVAYGVPNIRDVQVFNASEMRPFTIQDLSFETRAMIAEHYEMDFKLLDYPC